MKTAPEETMFSESSQLADLSQRLCQSSVVALLVSLPTTVSIGAAAQSTRYGNSRRPQLWPVSGVSVPAARPSVCLWGPRCSRVICTADSLLIEMPARAPAVSGRSQPATNANQHQHKLKSSAEADQNRFTAVRFTDKSRYITWPLDDVTIKSSTFHSVRCTSWF